MSDEKKSTPPELPKTVFVTMYPGDPKDEKSERFPTVDTSEEVLVDGLNQPTVIGRYELVSERTLVRKATIHEVTPMVRRDAE